MTPSIGIALFPRDGESVETLLKRSNMRMPLYEVKRGGRSAYRFFEAAMNKAANQASSRAHSTGGTSGW